MKQTFIFDLDGVIVNTAKYHFLAWKNLADRLGINFTQADNARLKGVSRVRSLEIILEIGDKTLGRTEFDDSLNDKNEDYLSYIKKMDASEILPGVLKTLGYLRNRERKLAIGSSSKNAKTVVGQLDIMAYFNTIVDGHDLSKSKPDPQVFLLAAKRTTAKPGDCVVFEDAEAGVQAANAGGMCSIGIGDKTTLSEADYVFSGFDEITPEFLDTL